MLAAQNEKSDRRRHFTSARSGQPDSRPAKSCVAAFRADRASVTGRTWHAVTKILTRALAAKDNEKEEQSQVGEELEGVNRSAEKGIDSLLLLLASDF